MALRPRGTAAHGLGEAQVARVAWTHGEYIGWRMAHPIYSQNPLIFFVWDYVLADSSFAGDVNESQALAPIAKRRSRGPESTRSSAGHVR